MENEIRHEELITRYLNGQCTEEENGTLKNWISESEENKRLFFGMKDIWDASAKTADHTEDQLLNFYKRLLEYNSVLPVNYWKKAVAYAAVLVIGLVSGYLIFHKEQTKLKNTVVYSVPLGSKSKLLLPDSTEVNLNSGSTLSYSAGFSSINRNITLSGEGFFHVKSDIHHPFNIHTADFDATVTGTQFNISAYEDDHFASTTLLEGKVSLDFAKLGKSAVLKPGQKILLDRATQKISEQEADTDTETAWKEGQFIFRNIPFPELIKRLERWYDVRLICNSQQLIEYHYSGRFKNQETIWQVLDAIQLTSPISYRKNNFREFEINYKPHRE